MTPQQTLSFQGRPEVKEFYLTRARAHRQADEILKGQYWADGKGCAVGCLIHGDRHEELARELGIPVPMAYLIDLLFEGQPNDTAKDFPVRFVEAIPVGVDLEPVMDRFFLALLSDPEQGVLLSANDAVREPIEAVIKLYRRQVEGDPPSRDEWSAADSAADSAANRAAYSAAYRAAYSAAYSAADSNHTLWQAEILLSLLTQAGSQQPKEMAHA